MSSPRLPGSFLLPLPYRDDFSDPAASLPPLAGEAGRRLVDAESIAGLDNGAVRFAPPLRQGWGRAALAYGPWERHDGLTLAAYLLNGHNTAQVEPLPDSLKARFDRWLRASEQDGRSVRLRAWLRSGRVRRTLRAFRWWWSLRKEQRAVPRLDENLAVGWYSEPAPPDPVGAGAGFVMHATGGENGELWVRAGGASQPVLRAVPDVPLALVVVLRGRGALYCAGATPPGCGLPGYPWVRPLAIDAQSDNMLVTGVVTPGAWGQIGFRIDTRVHAVHVAAPVAFASWCGPAVAADRLTGEAREPGTAWQAERGGAWEMSGGGFRRGSHGLVAEGPGALLLRPTAAEGIGLVHVLVANTCEGGAGILARAADANNCVRVTLARSCCAVHELAHGAATLLTEASVPPPADGAQRALQLRLDGGLLAVALDGKPVLEAMTTRAPCDGEGVGLHADDAQATFRDFEAQPTRLLLPPELCAAGLPVPAGGEELVADAFAGPARPLEGTTTSGGGLVWSRRIGRGRIELTGDGAARVVATAREPNPGRTAFTVPWRSHGLADLAVTMTIPGTGPGDWHKPRGGFLFRQDDDNFLIVSLWRGDEYPGASLSSFFHFRGFEDTYDAVWSNIGHRAWYGEQVRLRVAFDGNAFLAELDGQPVLYRRLTDFYADAQPLVINEVGLVANWEWGNDTGTVFRDFSARGTAVSR
jgi:hypothetical protein